MLGLTSPVLLGLVAGLVAALLGGVLWGWPRLAGPGWRSAVLRVLAVITLNCSVIALIFVAVNRANNFYSSWSDLFGRYHGGGTLRALHPAEPGPPASQLTSVIRVAPVQIGGVGPAGTLQTVEFRGQLSGLTYDGYVYLPPGYRSGRAAPHYPVLVVVTTSVASRSSPHSARRLATAIATQISAGRIGPLIAVIVPPGPASDPGCLDVPGGPQATLFFAQDLPAAIGSHYQIEPGAMALLGDASGGYCALHLVLSEAAVYGAAAVPPGGYQTPPGPPAWNNSPQLREQDNLLWLLRHQPMQPVTVLFTGSGSPIASLAAAPMRVLTVTPLTSVLDRLGQLVGG